MKKLARYVFLVAGFGILAVISFNPVSANTQAGQHAGAPAMDAESAAQLLPGSSQLINPQDLANVLQSAKSAKPLILNVGPYLLYAQAHIPGAEFIGPTSDSQAMDALLKRVKSLPHSQVHCSLLRMLPLGSLSQCARRLLCAVQSGFHQGQGTLHPQQPGR